MRVIDDAYRPLAAQALVEEEQVLGAEVVGLFGGAREGDGVFGVERVLPVVAAARLVAMGADDEAAHLFGIALASVLIDGVEHRARNLTTHIVFPISAARSSGRRDRAAA